MGVLDNRQHICYNVFRKVGKAKAHKIAMRESGLDKMIKVCYNISTSAKGGKRK
jgi:hypothetical protein